MMMSANPSNHAREEIKTLARIMRGNVGIIILTWTVLHIGSGLTFPLFPRFLEELGASPSMIGIVNAIGYLVITLQLIGGYLADRYGRKRLIVLTSFILTASMPLFICAKDWTWVFVGLILTNVAAMSGPAIWAILADSTRYEYRGRIYSLSWIVPEIVLTPTACLLAYIVSIYGVVNGVKIGYVVYFTMALISTILKAYFLKETHEVRPHAEDPGITSLYRDIISALKTSSRKFRLFLIYILVQSPATAVIFTYYVLYLAHIVGLSDSEISLIFAAANGFYLIFALGLGLLLDRFERVKLLYPLILLQMIGLLVLIVYDHNFITALFVSFLVLSIAFVITYAHSVLEADFTSKETRGRLLGVATVVRSFGFILGSIIGGVLYELSATVPFAMCITLYLASLFVLTLIYYPQRSQIRT